MSAPPGPGNPAPGPQALHPAVAGHPHHYNPPVRHLLDTLGGLWQLLRLFALSRFRLRGPYWRWRLETAFGHESHKSRWQTFIALVEYGRWVHRMRKK